MLSTDDIEILSSPLAPLASRSLIRATFEAERRGLMCVPATYPLMVPAPGGTLSPSLVLDVPQSEGSLVVTQIVPPLNSPHIRQTMRINVNNVWLGDGSVAAFDAFTVPRLYSGRLMSSPVVVPAGSQMTINVDDVEPYSVGEGVQVNGVGVRARLRGTRNLCEAPTDLAADWAAAVRAGGEWWGMTVTASQNANAVGVITSDVVVECVVISQRQTALEGEVHASDVQVKVGEEYLTPGLGPALGDLVSPDRVVVLPGLRWPVGGGAQVVVTPLYGAGTPIPVRVTLLGRRGGISGACWA